MLFYLKYLKILIVIKHLFCAYLKKINSDPLAFGDEANDSILTGDDSSSPALESPTLLQFGNGQSGGFHEVYVST